MRHVGDHSGACRHRRSGPVCVLVAALLAGCNSATDGGTACTDLFAYATAVAVDESGQPVLVTAVSDTVLRTGAGFDVTQYGFLSAAGTIVVFSDSYIGMVRQAGDSVRVTGAGGGKHFTTTYQFGTDACHIRRLSGPDTVVVR